MTDLMPTNFKVIETEYNDIIKFIREIDKDGKISNAFIKRKTYVLINGYKFYVTEVLKQGRIDFYYYDLYDENGKELIKFHSESHAEKDYQTSTEPFHVHGSEDSKLTNVKRYPNKNFKTLFDILEFIRFMFIFNKEYPKL